ncbi:MAG: hypothetical protein Q4C85_00185 [Actinomyces sp.]|uniref:hypothetical protein n=1 Tax=Actinomyces sp. TaxID=29317 RepID=UPI0026DCD70B|nr:hypothetical protein [Actinomyces sp.]MDO4242184.1 hypothetical protein [Actinomyces sp.]
MKRRAFLSRAALGALLLPILAACGSGSQGSDPSQGSAASGAAGDASAPTTPPTAFGETADLPVSVEGSGSRFARVGGRYAAGIARLFTGGGSVTFYTDLTTMDTRVITADPATGEYATATTTDVTAPAQGEAAYSLTASTIVVEDDNGYALVILGGPGTASSAQDSEALTEEDEASTTATDTTEGPARVDLLKIALADGTVSATTTLWDTGIVPEEQGTMAGLRLSTDGSVLIAQWGTDHIASVRTEDLSTVVSDPQDLDGYFSSRDACDYVTGEWEGGTLISLTDGTEVDPPETMTVSRIVGHIAYGVTWDGTEGLGAYDLSTGTEVDQTGPIPDTVDLTTEAAYHDGYLVTIGQKYVEARKPGDPAPAVSWSADSGRPIPSSATVLDDVLYLCFEDQPETITLIDLTTGADITSTAYPSQTVAGVSPMAAVDAQSTIILATDWKS